KGKWSAADDAWNDKNKAVIKKLVKAHQDAVAAADKKKIKVAPKNKEWLDLWASYKKDLRLIGTKQQ
ncbi:MAG: hypothetical protein JRJ85_16115, partial [Deltaproteobacteria bacterium]|nr:hypothetical protein [Deltaproteobacteria bacterium]